MTPPARSDRNRPSDHSGARFLAWLGILLLVLWLTFVGGAWAGIYLVRLRVVSLVLIVLVLATWAVIAWRRPDWRPSSAIWPAFAIALAAFAASTVFSRNPRISVEYLAWAVLLTGLYLLCRRLLADDFFRPRLMGLSIALCAAISVLYIAVCVGHWVSWWSLVGHFAVPPLRPLAESLTLGNPSAVMTLSVLLLAPAVAHLGFATPARRATVAVLVVLALLVTLLSGSRSGWLGLAIGVAITAIAWLVATEHRAAVRRTLAGRTARLTVAGVLVSLAACAVVFGPRILTRAAAGGEDQRASFYAVAIRMAGDSPIVGSGPGMWVAQRIAYTQPSEVDYYIPHAHDIYLQTLAEFGIVGVAAGLIAVGCLLWLVRNAIRDADPTRRRYGWAVLFATAYFGAHQLLDFYPNLPAVLFAYALPIAWLDATSPRPIGRAILGAGARRLAAPALATAVVASIVVLGWSESSALQQGDAVAAANEGNWSMALAPATAAVAADPAMPANQFTLGIVAARNGDLATATTAFRAAAAADSLPESWLNLAALDLASGNSTAARADLDAALRLGEQQPIVQFDAGWLYEQLGDWTNAERAYTTSIEAFPSLAGDPFWTATQDRASHRATILARASQALGPAAAFDIALSAGETGEAARAAAAITDPDAQALAELVLQAWGGDAVARSALETRAVSHPFDVTTLAWCSRIAERFGDHAGALRFRQWADIASGSIGATGLTVRVTDAGPINPAGSNAEFYGQYTYRRPTPWDQLVPGLPHLAFQ